MLVIFKNCSIQNLVDDFIVLFNIKIENVWNLLKYKPGDPLLFNTSLFLILFFFFLIVYNLFKNNKPARVFSLIVFSFYFYYLSAGYFTAILIVSAVINFFFGKQYSMKCFYCSLFILFRRKEWGNYSDSLLFYSVRLIRAGKA